MVFARGHLVWEKIVGSDINSLQSCVIHLPRAIFLSRRLVIRQIRFMSTGVLDKRGYDSV